MERGQGNLPSFSMSKQVKLLFKARHIDMGSGCVGNLSRYVKRALKMFRFVATNATLVRVARFNSVLAYCLSKR